MDSTIQSSRMRQKMEIGRLRAEIKAFLGLVVAVGKFRETRENKDNSRRKQVAVSYLKNNA